MEYPINEAGIALLEEFETFVGHAYPDPYSPLGKALRKRGLWLKCVRNASFVIPLEMRHLSGAPWTIGYGFTDGVKLGDRMTIEQARVRLAIELQDYVDGVERACEVVPTDNQLAAMVCLAWNIGVPRFLKSSVLKAHNRGDFASASRAFGLWNKAGGEESSGLVRRRAAEKVLYLTPPADRAKEPTPQAVEAESRMVRSPIVVGTSATTVVATVATLAETSTQVKTIRDGLGLGDYAPHVMLALAVGIGGYVVWQRLKQRAKGWA